jgi:tetratricopeptide (TPR) repeat protein
MKASRREAKHKLEAVPAQAKSPRHGLYWAIAAAAVAVLFWAYGPALHGPFLFDDNTLPFALPGFDQPLKVWLANVRPVLFFTYWINNQISRDDTYSYHVTNLIIHLIASGLVFLMVRRLLELAKAPASRQTLLAGFAAAIFLLHPVQTEAVAYLAGRSESLSVMLVFAAFTLFLYRREARVTWGVTAAVLLLFGAALFSKEHTIVLPALLLLTDYWWNPGFSFAGIRGNWKLYGVMALGAAAALAKFWNLIFHGGGAGFGLTEFTWYQYLFTQFRALFVYIGEFLLPVNLNIDWDFPISHTILEHGAIAGLAVWLALIGAAWYYRRRFPLASYGLLVYLLLMSPTSSILPIKDPVAERRLYFSIVGLLLIVVDVLSRVKVDYRKLAWVCGIVTLVAAGVTHARASVWGDQFLLWHDTAAKSPNKSRVHWWLAMSYYERQQYDLALAEFEKTAQLERPVYQLLIDWGLAYDALNQPGKALEKLRQAAALDATAHVYSQIGMVYAKSSQYPEALEALATAERLDPAFARTYLYRGKIFLKTGRVPEAVVNYQRALALDRNLEEARQDLAQVQSKLRPGR